MLTTTMKWAAIAALIIGIFWQSSLDHLSYLNFVITAGAVLAVIQAVGLHKYLWAVAFVAIGCLFNPVFPFGFSFKIMVGLQILSAAVFAGSLKFLHTGPIMTIASITDANPKTESL